jgi:hypothetical protein
MNYQKDLICVRCEQKGTIRKVKLHNLFAPNDEHVYFVCIGCKSYGPMYESLTTNAEDFPLMLDDEWEWADESLLTEPVEEITLEEFEETIKANLAKRTANEQGK